VMARLSPRFRRNGYNDCPLSVHILTIISLESG
jgi:hypothetical protein